jgi:hypothetical protein
MSALTIIRNDDVVLTATFTDADGNAIDLTGSKVYFTVKENESDADADALITKEVTSHSDPTAGETQISLNPTDTNVDPGTYFYDLQVKNSLGTIQSTSSDKITIRQDISSRVS